MVLTCFGVMSARRANSACDKPRASRNSARCSPGCVAQSGAHEVIVSAFGMTVSPASFLMVVNNVDNLDCCHLRQVKSAVLLQRQRIVVWSKHDPPVSVYINGEAAFIVTRKHVPPRRRVSRNVGEAIGLVKDVKSHLDALCEVSVPLSNRGGTRHVL